VQNFVPLGKDLSGRSQLEPLFTYASVQLYFDFLKDIVGQSKKRLPDRLCKQLMAPSVKASKLYVEKCFLRQKQKRKR
jgi:hypothetical protein